MSLRIPCPQCGAQIGEKCRTPETCLVLDRKRNAVKVRVSPNADRPCHMHRERELEWKRLQAVENLKKQQAYEREWQKGKRA